MLPEWDLVCPERPRLLLNSARVFIRLRWDELGSLSGLEGQRASFRLRRATSTGSLTSRTRASSGGLPASGLKIRVLAS